MTQQTPNFPNYQVLLATTDAPIYFHGPVCIEDKDYVDGGVGGNCPLKQVHCTFNGGLLHSFQAVLIN